jgi:hypothetical protein
VSAVLRRRALPLLLAAFCAALGGAALAGPAAAAPSDSFIYKSSFDGSSTPDGSFTPGQLAVNYATGNILLYDSSDGDIEQVDPSGKPVNFSGLGSPSIPLGIVENFFSKVRVIVDNTGGATQGNIYVMQGANALYGFGPNGKSLSANYPIADPFGYSCGAALSPNGNIWILSRNFGFPSAAVEYSPAGVAPGKEVIVREDIQFGNCTAIFDSPGNLYVNTETGDVVRYDGSASYVEEGPTGQTNGIQFDLDPNTDDLYVDHGKTITGTRYSDPLVKSAPFETIGGIDSAGMAFDATGETLYVVEGARIDIFHREPPSPPQILEPLTLTQVRSESAFAQSAIKANGAATGYHLEYGTDTSYGQTFPIPDIQVPFSHFRVDLAPEKIVGLKPNTTYHVRLVATNSAGTTYGADRVFTTYATPPGGYGRL